jgi:hypothetical protein
VGEAMHLTDDTVVETIEPLISALRLALHHDPVTMDALMNTRYECNERLANHPNFPVRLNGEGNTELGALAIINGVLDALGYDQKVVMQNDEEGNAINFFASVWKE